MSTAVLQNGTIIAGYRIDGALGEGGMGTVYRATQLSLERVVAFKVVAAALSADISFRERFRREGQLQAVLDHPHIVPVYEAGESDNLLFLAMRLIEGTTLKALIEQRELGDRRALRLLTQVGDALDAAHDKGLVHRDVKPQNILVGAGDHAYLTDFGLTKARGGTVMTEAGHFVGTIDYIAPEQARGEIAKPASDVYSLTCVLCECLTGQPPFVRPTEERTLFAHLTDPPPKLTALRPDLPPAIDDVIASGMAKEASDRPASARELMIEVRRAMGMLPAAAPGDDTDAGATRLATAPEQGATRIAKVSDTARAASTQPRAGGALPPPGAAPGDAAAVGAGAAAFVPPAAEAPPARMARGGALALVAILALIGAGIGVALGGKSHTPYVPYTSTASAGPIALSFPSTWQSATSAPDLSGLTLSDPLAITASSGTTPVSLVAGTSSATGPTLLPAGLSSSLPRPTAVQLGNVQALRYDAVALPSEPGPFEIYAVPTTSGVVTLLCQGPASAPARAVCDRIVGTLRLIGGTTAYPLTAASAYAAQASKTMAALTAATAPAERALASATTPTAQAAAATKLSAAYAVAARSLSALRLSPAVSGINTAVVQGLSSVSTDYAHAADAARRNDATGYRLAATAVQHDASTVSGALAQLPSAVY